MGQFGQVRVKTNGRHITVRRATPSYASDIADVRLGLEDMVGNDREIAYLSTFAAKELGEMLLALVDAMTAERDERNE